MNLRPVTVTARRLAAVCLLGLLAPALAHAARPLAAGKDFKPEDPTLTLLRDTWDCSTRATLDLAPGLSGAFADSTTEATNLLSTYSCRGWLESGPENVYELVVPAGAEVEFWAGLRDLGDLDLDLFLLEACDSEACLAGENSELSALLGPGTYYLVVDGFDDGDPDTPDRGPYTLAWECRWPGVPPQVCAPDGAHWIDCGVGTEIPDGSLGGRPNLIQAYDCSGIVERGGEVWYAITLPANHGFSFVAAPDTVLDDPAPNLDLALWLFDGCGPDAVCLAFADEYLSGQTERIDWVNAAAEPDTVFLAVDCPRPPEAQPDGSFVPDDAFLVDFPGAGNVAGERRPLGGVRALFR